MRIGIVSDSHDRVEVLRSAVDFLSDRCDVLLHAGDLSAPVHRGRCWRSSPARCT